MSDNAMWLTTEYPQIVFENTEVGRLKKKLWDMSDKEIDEVLAKYDIPSPPELGVPGTYIQTTPRHLVLEKRRKNDVVILPVGCTENHGRHTVSGLDSFMCSQIVEGVRRYTAKKGREVAIAHNPFPYGAHPYHHLGMPGTIVIPQDVARDYLVSVMAGLWNDGYRKQLYINNHGQLWVLESAVHEFFYRYQVPAVIQVMDWHRAIREFFYPGIKGQVDTAFVHADESETSVGMLLFPEGMVDLSMAQEAWSKQYLPVGRFDNSTDSYGRPQRWSESEGHTPITLKGTPEGIVGVPANSTAQKAKRPVAAILEYLDLCIDQLLEAFPPGTVPPSGEITQRDPETLAPYLKEPGSEGWKSLYALEKECL
jgi:creatinine amidohydrolase